MQNESNTIVQIIAKRGHVGRTRTQPEAGTKIHTNSKELLHNDHIKVF